MIGDGLDIVSGISPRMHFQAAASPVQAADSPVMAPPAADQGPVQDADPQVLSPSQLNSLPSSLTRMPLKP